jgi:hypothetical protein
MRLPQHWFGSLHPIATVALLILLQPLWPVFAQPPAQSEEDTFASFTRQAKSYISMEHGLPADKLRPTEDVVALENERQTLRQALQQARPNAKQGDLFTPEVAKEFRRLLGQTMKGPDGPKIRASLAHAEPLAPSGLTVNAAWPNTRGQPIQSVPPSLLQNLPALPKGLEYSIAGNTLALRDTAANLVVDFLPNALP